MVCPGVSSAMHLAHSQLDAVSSRLVREMHGVFIKLVRADVGKDDRTLASASSSYLAVVARASAEFDSQLDRCAHTFMMLTMCICLLLNIVGLSASNNSCFLISLAHQSSISPRTSRVNACRTAGNTTDIVICHVCSSSFAL